MAQTLLTLQLAFNGKSPIVAGDKRTTALNAAQLIYALAHGSRYREPGGSSPYLQYQTGVVQASGTVTPASVQSGDTVSIGGQALTAAQKRATGTVTPGTAGDVPVAGDTITVNGVVFTAVDGAVVLGEATFDVSGNTAAQCASIAAQVSGYASPLLTGRVAARASATVVTFYAVEQGTGGNAITLGTSDNTRLAKSGATLANGAALSNNTFDFAGSNATTGAALAAAIEASTTAAVKKVNASASAAGVVTVTAKEGGTAGNGIAFVSSDGTRLAVSGSGTLENGAADAPLKFTF